MNTSAEPIRGGGDVVRRIWSLCHILRGDGVSYHEYISELTYLLFLKIAEETKTEASLPDGCRWRDLVAYDGPDLLTFYRDMLTFLGGHADSLIVQEIYAFPTTVFCHSENLRAVINGISRLDWHSIDCDGMGNIYEGLLARNAQDARSGAGQYFTPRPLVDSIVHLARPAPGEVIQDPSCGSGGFLISAQEYARRQGFSANALSFEGVEIEKGTYRICQMNSFLHDLRAKLILGNALTEDARALSPANLILANPPFGSKSGSVRRLRDELPQRNGSKQLAFLQHIRLGLKQGGRAAVVVPDSVLFEKGAGRIIRQDLMAECDLHTMLRLPNGIFYSQGVNTNVLFFTRRIGAPSNSERIWVYDMRSGMPRFGKTRPLLPSHFAEFEALFGSDPNGRAHRAADPQNDRWRSFSRAEIASRNDDLDVTWLAAETPTEADGLTAQEAVASAMFHLQSALSELETLVEDLSSEGVTR